MTELDGVQAVISSEQRTAFASHADILTVVLVGCVIATLGVSFVTFVLQLRNERARMVREALAKKNALPTCTWQLAEGQRYTAFLSHYKVGAAHLPPSHLCVSQQA